MAAPALGRADLGDTLMPPPPNHRDHATQVAPSRQIGKIFQDPVKYPMEYKK